MKVLRLVASLELPDCYVAAGFVRNMVWDYLHQYPSTNLNDIDVVYFDRQETNDSVCQQAEKSLRRQAPEINWQVKNQAVMHLKNDDRPYENTVDAMRFWPEKETAVGVQIAANNQIYICAPFGLESLFRGEITFNPKRNKTLFLDRIGSKQWQNIWPELKVVL